MFTLLIVFYWIISVTDAYVLLGTDPMNRRGRKSNFDLNLKSQFPTSPPTSPPASPPASPRESQSPRNIPRRRFGKIVMDNGALYSGALQNDIPHRDGTLWDSKNRLLFQGKWKKGYPIYGISYFKDGIQGKEYEGTFKYGMPHGNGSFFYQDVNNAVRYTGQVYRNKADGYGIVLTKYKTKLYEGYFKDGLPFGKGIYYFENGLPKYEGDVKYDKYDGMGILITKQIKWMQI